MRRLVSRATSYLPHFAHIESTALQIRQGDEPLADDELVIIGKAWARSKFSMHALKKIVSAILEARVQNAIGHGR